MTKAFYVLINRNDENVHFKLIGNFDDKAVNKLINALNLHARNASKIFIHTDEMNIINDHDGREFQNRMYNSSEELNIRILSTGRFSRMFSPAKANPYFV